MNFILVAVLAIAAVLLIVLVRANKAEAATRPPETEETKEAHQTAATCCGAHEVCEAETLLALSDKIIYYEDEELDTYRGTPADAYTEEQIDEFRDVLLTLQTYEVAGWMRSLALRQIVPPTEIREEALMIVDDFREERKAKNG